MAVEAALSGTGSKLMILVACEHFDGRIIQGGNQSWPAPATDSEVIQSINSHGGRKLDGFARWRVLPSSSISSEATESGSSWFRGCCTRFDSKWLLC